MNEISLQELVASYELLFKYGERLCREEGDSAVILLKLYAMMSAYQLCVCIGASGWNEIENAAE